MSALGTQFHTPYKGLAPFEDSELDELLFFGREREREVIVANMLASKLTILYGPSGVGKSSILRAGVARQLREEAPNADVYVLNEWADEPTLPDPADEAFLILDQFEEYFLYHEHGPLYEELPALLERPHVHVLLALREDAVARLDAFQARIPNVLANRVGLDHLDALSARAAIVGPLDRWNAAVPGAERIIIETALVGAVLEQVATGPDRIEAPYLQLVLERVWEEERASGSQRLRAETLRRLGGARAIVSSHLERALEALPPRDAEIATSALKFLVTPSLTKISYSFADLVGYTDESPVELQHVLELLASQRILRSVEGERYEIFHDVLAEPVLTWRRDFEAKAAVEREREAARRSRRRLIAFAAGAATLAAVFAALTVYAFAQRNEAAKQRHAARLQADAALGQKLQAQQQAKTMKRLRLVALAQKKKAEAAKREADASADQAQESEAQAQASAEQAQQSAKRAQASEQQAQASKADAVHQRAVAEQLALRAKQAAKASKRSAHIAQEKSRELKVVARRAKVGELVAQSAAKLGVDPVVSIRRAVAAAQLEKQSPRVEDALRTALAARHVEAILPGVRGAVNAAVFSPDGKVVATGDDVGSVQLFRTPATEAVHSTRRLGMAANEPVHAVHLGSAVLVLAFSPDGRTLLAGPRDGGARLIDVATGDVTRTLPQSGAVLSAAFAAGGKLVVTGGGDKTLRIWDAVTGDLRRTISGSRNIRALAVSGSLVAVVGSGDPVARVYSLPSGDLVASLTQQAEVTDAAFSPSGDLLVTTGRRNGYVWNTSDWSQRHLLVGHEAAITDVVFAADGRAVTSSIDSSARVWDPLTGESLFVLSSQHQQKVLAVAVSPDGSQIATASADTTTRLWKEPLGSIPTVLAGDHDAVTAVSYSPDGRHVLTASADGTARLWDPTVPTLSQLASQPGAVSTVAYSPDGKLVLSAGADSSARLWRLDGRLHAQLQQGGRVNSAAFVDKGRVVLTGGEDGTAKLWNTPDGSLAATFAHGAPVRAAVATPNGVVTGGADGIVRAWTRAGRPLWSSAQGSPVTTLVQNGDVAAAGSADGSIRILRLANGVLLHALHGHSDAITSLAFDPKGQLLASGSADATARIWNADTGRVVHVLKGHLFGITSIVFNPAGDLVLTASVDGEAKLWSVKTGRSVHRLPFHVSVVSQASFSPDGRWVVTAGPTTAGLWQVRTGLLTNYFRGLTGQFLSVAFSPDSRQIVAGTATGIVGAYDCILCGRTPSLLAQARGVLRTLQPTQNR